MVSEPTSESGVVLLGGCPGLDTVEPGSLTETWGAIGLVA
jgi:hypothetical protein